MSSSSLLSLSCSPFIFFLHFFSFQLFHCYPLSFLRSRSRFPYFAPLFFAPHQFLSFSIHLSSLLSLNCEYLRPRPTSTLSFFLFLSLAYVLFLSFFLSFSFTVFILPTRHPSPPHCSSVQHLASC
ncbi:MAG: hypothetical protein J3R72DRAFT_434688 [Linnemannia gamsii]|nr:MAG: hypothetical protein J3R72DRAFT_434688 [Linnemannia gamsii]